MCAVFSRSVHLLRVFSLSDLRFTFLSLFFPTFFISFKKRPEIARSCISRATALRDRTSMAGRDSLDYVNEKDVDGFELITRAFFDGALPEDSVYKIPDEVRRAYVGFDVSELYTELTEHLQYLCTHIRYSDQTFSSQEVAVLQCKRLWSVDQLNEAEDNACLPELRFISPGVSFFSLSLFFSFCLGDYYIRTRSTRAEPACGALQRQLFFFFF
jgi:hypothetical protein